MKERLVCTRLNITIINLRSMTNDAVLEKNILCHHIHPSYKTPDLKLHYTLDMVS